MRAARVVRTGKPKLLLLALLCIQGGAVLVAATSEHDWVELVFRSGRPLGSLHASSGMPYSLLGSFAGVPLAATARFLAYADPRTRRDGSDIQVRFSSIRTATPFGALHAARMTPLLLPGLLWRLVSPCLESLLFDTGGIR